MGALLIPFMGSASPVMPAVEPCWDAALATDTLTKAASRDAVEPLCAALLCMESAFGGNKGDEQRVKQKKLPGSRDPLSRGLVWSPITHAQHTHTKNPTTPKPSGGGGLVDSLATPTPSAIHCDQSYDLLFLSSALLRRMWQLLPGKVIHSAHLLIHAQWPPQAALLPHRPHSQPAFSTAANRQGGESELTMSLVRHFHFTLATWPKTALFIFFCRPISELTKIRTRSSCKYI